MTRSIEHEIRPILAREQLIGSITRFQNISEMYNTIAHRA
jgi:hypothetical protein